MDHEIVCLSERLGIVSENLPVVSDDFFTLKAGDSVIQIGDGPENGCFRTDKFESPVKYVGICTIEELSIRAMAAFEVKPNIYLLYDRTEYEVVGYHKQYTRFYAPKFTVVEPN